MVRQGVQGKLKAAGRLDSIRLLGVRIDRLTLQDLLHFVEQVVIQRTRSIILYVNIHCMNARERDSEYARILEQADVVYCDGTGVRLGSIIAGEPLPARMTGADWIHDLCRLAVRRNFSLFLVGSAPGSAEAAASTLQISHPGLQIAGTLPGYDLAPDSIRQINEASPDIVLVGMGTPTQEKWIEQHRVQIDAPVVWAVGALFDFVSGRIARGPRFLTDSGFEWLCRLVVEPAKLWRRYLIGNPLFISRVIRHYWLRRLLAR